jgi:hypothetical protein
MALFCGTSLLIHAFALRRPQWPDAAPQSAVVMTGDTGGAPEADEHRAQTASAP